MKVLILCTGNSCRSQMAEGWLRSWDENATVVSARTKLVGRVNSMAVEVMAEVNVDISEGKAKEVRDELRRRLAEFYVREVQGRELSRCECKD